MRVFTPKVDDDAIGLLQEGGHLRKEARTKEMVDYWGDLANRSTIEMFLAQLPPAEPELRQAFNRVRQAAQELVGADVEPDKADAHIMAAAGPAARKAGLRVVEQAEAAE